MAQNTPEGRTYNRETGILLFYERVIPRKFGKHKSSEVLLYLVEQYMIVTLYVLKAPTAEKAFPRLPG